VLPADEVALPFEDSRRLTGSNLFFATTGAVLELRGVAPDPALCTLWRRRVERARAHLSHAQLGWNDGPMSDGSGGANLSIVRPHAHGASLALAAPCDQLFLATEINEWALCASLLEQGPLRWRELEAALCAEALAQAVGTPNEPPGLIDPPVGIDPPVLDDAAALARFARLSKREARPGLHALLEAADAHELPYVLDETTLTLGAGTGAAHFELTMLPRASELPWTQLHDVPTAVITGSNGKTTTVRLLAACARAHGWRSGYNCTDGVLIGTECIARGDYAGPVGARLVLRDARTEAAVLEVARGGILRRGIALARAHAALITNISADHFGEYGVDDLSALADVKLSVAALLNARGVLVLNADDATLRAKAGELARRFRPLPKLAWFALDADHPTLQAHRATGGATCGVRGGTLYLSTPGEPGEPRESGEGTAPIDLGAIAAMPLSVEGHAPYNVANLAGAALAAAAFGIAGSTIAAVFRQFGADPADNGGRLMRFEVGGVRVLLDYAHNPEGLRALLGVATQLRAQGSGGRGRLGLILGHAGNRRDEDLQDVARVAAEFHPDLIVVKEDEAHLRGRAPGEVPQLIRAALLRSGLPAAALPVAPSELEAVRWALAWARPGDVLALPVHGSAARAAVLDMLRAPSMAR